MKDTWDKNPLHIQAALIGYDEIRQHDEAKELELHMMAAGMKRNQV